MKIKEVPQDDIKTFKGFGTKAIYAVDENGRYARTSTSGWEAEEVVLRDVVDDFAKMAEDAKTRVFKGETSPIEYYMNKYGSSD
jgi:phosphosulfolactate synthase (CoM biosynthesis protein A)